MKQFPANFMWGSATSSYQVEGNNQHADWWAWEQAAHREPSGVACRHVELYEKDFDLAQELHHNTHRLSIEWSRVEPRDGEIDVNAIAHYQRVVKALKARGLEPVVTLHHFTIPQWMAQQGGWASGRVVAKFLRFCERIVTALAPQVRWWITINEPTIYISHGFIWGWWPPNQKSLLKAIRVRSTMIEAHIGAYALIKNIYRDQRLDAPQVSLSHHVQAYIPCHDTLRNRWSVKLREKMGNFDILDQLHRHKTLDFIGMNYYSRQMVDVSSWWIGDMLTQVSPRPYDAVPKNSLGWDIYPVGLRLLLTRLHQRYHLPLMITENGICTLDDQQRWDFIRDHLVQVHAAMADGAQVIGYLYWSLLDNFEWDKGYAPRFGLVEMDYATQQRRVRDSARKFARVCHSGTLEG